MYEDPGGNNVMKRCMKIAGVLVCVVSLLMVGGCLKKPDLTEETIEQDLLKSGAKHDSSIDLLKLEVLDQKQSQDALDVSAEIRYFTSEVKVDSTIVLHYQWEDGAWKYIDADETPSNTFVKNYPPEDIFKKPKELQYSKDSHYLKYTIQDAELSYWVHDMDPEPTHGKVSYIVHETTSGDYLSLSTEYTVEANYELEEGWQVEVVDWKRTVTFFMIQGLNGGFKLTWDNAFSMKHGLASDPSKSVYRVDEPIESLVLEGEIRLIEGKDTAPYLENELSLMFDYQGKSFTKSVKTEGLDPTHFTLEVNDDPRSTITFQLYAAGEGPDTSTTYPYLTILDPFNVSARIE